MTLSILGVLALLQLANCLILENGTYVMCGTTPEQHASHTTGNIRGGFDTIHPEKRQACSDLTKDQTWHRTYDGTCNTRDDLGAAFSHVKRLMPPMYQDKKGAPRDLSKRGRPMPSARAVSVAVHKPRPKWSKYSLMVMQFGQMLDHDTSVAMIATGFENTMACCGKPKHEQYIDCYTIKVPRGDRVFKEDCMEFVRSDPMTLPNGTIVEPRTQINAITAWVDASNIYGSDSKRAKKLRSRNETGALLKTSWYKGKERLPKGHSNDCINLEPTHYCAMAGDDRSNEQPGLTAIHTVFHLEHNRQVRKLVKVILYRQGRPYSDRDVETYLNTAPDKIQERLYQVVRKVLGAVWQNIVYNEYLPEVVGPSFMHRYELWSERPEKYRPHVDPSISHEFLTCAFRFGHTLVNDWMLTDKMRNLKTLFGTSMHNLENFNRIVKGLVSPDSHAEFFDTGIAESLVDSLFANEDHKLDLAALNIQRGRDHAIGRYNELRKRFGLKPFKLWKNFGRVWSQMKEVYEHIDDVECFPGGTAERPVRGGVVGETFAHIIAQQFHDLKYGDRYFFQTDDTYYGFTRDELKALTKLCFSKILCENAKMAEIQENPFQLPLRRSNKEYKCEGYPDIDMWEWSQLFVY